MLLLLFVRYLHLNERRSSESKSEPIFYSVFLVPIANVLPLSRWKPTWLTISSAITCRTPIRFNRYSSPMSVRPICFCRYIFLDICSRRKYNRRKIIDMIWYDILYILLDVERWTITHCIHGFISSAITCRTPIRFNRYSSPMSVRPICLRMLTSPWPPATFWKFTKITVCDAGFRIVVVGVSWSFVLDIEFWFYFLFVFVIFSWSVSRIKMRLKCPPIMAQVTSQALQKVGKGTGWKDESSDDCR